MKILIIAVIATAFTLSFGACKSSSSSGKTFCDTACLKDSIKFTGDHILKPYIYITASKCVADTLTWSVKGMGVERKMNLDELLGRTVRINKDYLKCIFKDTAYAWLKFNDCATGQGYLLRMPFNKTAIIRAMNTGINNLDPKFSVADNLVAYTDRGNIFTEDMATGKKAMMTFGKDIGIEFNAIHDFIDSVNITPTRIWVKVKMDNAWKEMEKKITLE